MVEAVSQNIYPTDDGTFESTKVADLSSNEVEFLDDGNESKK